MASLITLRVVAGRDGLGWPGRWKVIARNAADGLLFLNRLAQHRGVMRMRPGRRCCDAPDVVIQRRAGPPPELAGLVQRRFRSRHLLTWLRIDADDRDKSRDGLLRSEGWNAAIVTVGPDLSCVFSKPRFIDVNRATQRHDFCSVVPE